MNLSNPKHIYVYTYTHTHELLNKVLSLTKKEEP